MRLLPGLLQGEPFAGRCPWWLSSPEPCLPHVTTLHGQEETEAQRAVAWSSLSGSPGSRVEPCGLLPLRLAVCAHVLLEAQASP